MPASDLAEGLLNNVDRPPVHDAGDRRASSTPAEPLPHFNEVDEGCGGRCPGDQPGLDGMGLDPETTLHDVRWGDEYDGQFVWVFEISGAVPARTWWAATPAR